MRIACTEDNVDLINQSALPNRDRWNLISASNIIYDNFISTVYLNNTDFQYRLIDSNGLVEMQIAYRYKNELDPNNPSDPPEKRDIVVKRIISDKLNTGIQINDIFIYNVDTTEVNNPKYIYYQNMRDNKIIIYPYPPCIIPPIVITQKPIPYRNCKRKCGEKDGTAEENTCVRRITDYIDDDDNIDSKFTLITADNRRFDNLYIGTIQNHEGIEYSTLIGIDIEIDNPKGGNPIALLGCIGYVYTQPDSRTFFWLPDINDDKINSGIVPGSYFILTKDGYYEGYTPTDKYRKYTSSMTYLQPCCLPDDESGFKSGVKIYPTSCLPPPVPPAPPVVPPVNSANSILHQKIFLIIIGICILACLILLFIYYN